MKGTAFLLIFFVANLTTAQEISRIQFATGKISICLDSNIVRFNVVAQGDSSSFTYLMEVGSNRNFKPFIVFENGKCLNEPFVNFGDSIFLVALPDWNNLFYVFKIDTRNHSKASHSKLKPLLVLENSYGFVNLKQGYIATAFTEISEYMYLNSSFHLDVLELYDVLGRTKMVSLRRRSMKLLKNIEEYEEMKSIYLEWLNNSKLLE